jgi:tetratricopeptide (TPR) repeat protein
LFTQLEKRKDVWDIEIPEKQVESFLERKFDSDEEMALAYEKAIVHWPESSEIIITLSRIYEDNFMECKGKNLLEKSVKEFPSNAEIQYHYGRFLVTNFGKDSFKSIFDKINTDELTDDAKGNIYWLYSFAFDNSEKNISYDYLKKYLKINPDSINGNVNAAQIACDLERYEESIGFWNKLIELDPEDTRYHWDRLVPSTLAEDWPLVRLSAQALGIELETKDGPVYQEMEFIRLKFIDEMGDSDILLAKRTGLVTARVTSIKSLGEEQRYKHDVVFDATPSNALDQEDEDGYACDSEGYYTLLFSVVKTVREPKTLIIEVDGINPGKEKIANLEEIVSHLGYELDQRSSDEYIITMDDEVEHPGWYAYMMIPEDSSNAELQVLNEKMKEYSSLLEHPLVWPILLEKLGDEELLQQQSEIQEKYNL